MMSLYETSTFAGKRWEALARVGWGWRAHVRIQPGMGTKSLESDSAENRGKQFDITDVNFLINCSVY